MVRKQTNYLDTVTRLVKSHFKCDRQMEQVFLCSIEADGIIRLLEVSQSVPPLGEILPFDFDPAPNDGIPYPSSIILIAPEDMKAIKRGKMDLPVNWLPLQQAVDCSYLKQDTRIARTV